MSDETTKERAPRMPYDRVPNEDALIAEGRTRQIMVPMTIEEIATIGHLLSPHARNPLVGKPRLRWMAYAAVENDVALKGVQLALSVLCDAEEYPTLFKNLGLDDALSLRLIEKLAAMDPPSQWDKTLATIDLIDHIRSRG